MFKSTDKFRDDILTQKSLLLMSNMISNKLLPPRKLTKIEALNFIELVRPQSDRNWAAYTTSQIQEILVNQYLQKYFTDKGRAESKEEFDIHEVMKKQLVPDAPLPTINEDGDPLSSAPQTPTVVPPTSIADIFGISTLSAIQKIMNPSAAYVTNNIVCDSKNRLTNSDGTQEFSWNFLNNSPTITTGAVNSIGSVKNVISIRIPPIRIPYKDVVFIGAQKRVSMCIKEFSTQATVGTSCRYHFLFSAEADDNMISLLPLPLDRGGIFQFAKPITQLDQITLTFGNPLEPLVFDTDRQNVSITYTDEPNFATIDGSPHNLQTGDQVFFATFNTLDPLTDQAVITAMNSLYGFNCYVTSPSEFTIEQDLSVVTAPFTGPLNTFQAYYGSKRLIVPMELTYLGDGTTD